MSEMPDNIVPHARVRSLRDAIRKVQLGEVERSDVVVELQDAEKARLELLAEEMQDVFREIPDDDDQFTLQIATGSTARFWVDVTSHVVMGGDRKTYRFVKDTRLGRMVVLETASVDDMADCLTEYIAERILEREKAIEGDWLNARLRQANAGAPRRSLHKGRGSSWLALSATFLIGLLMGVLGLFAYAWFANPL
ncbi:hypothetical protein [Roseibium aestuarii]|uniref:Uncharacterized protein n=1 Tax=Roseibium aestuarii TaxID=2600299 RepID=A0ABW4JX96_9HYPH|nr:hypothetical protein [Roseibium aestuarii]